MNYVVVFFTLLVFSPSLHAEELVSDVSLSEEPMTVTAEPGTQLQPLVEIANPGVTLPVYALKGMIRYEDVEGDGYLQLDNHFGERGTFFTKSLAPEGPLGKITGSSDWRPFTLPFSIGSGDQADGAASFPERLSLSLHLPASGTVSIRDVALFQYASGENPLRSSGQWFGNRGSGLIGGIGGAIVGLWGALIGFLAGQGKARRFALGSTNILFIVGIVCIVGGVVALASAQPYAVYYSLLLLGIIIVAVFGMLRRTLAARYEQLELKRMQSMDA